MAWFARLRNLFRSDKVSDEIDREIAFHLAERTDDLVATGMHRRAAEREARRRFGNRTLQHERIRDRDLLVWLETFVADVRYALRALAASPGFAFVAIVSLALGIGANTAIFTLINAVMLKSLPVSDPNRLVILTVNKTGAKGPATFDRTQWEAIRDRQDMLASVALYGATGSGDLSLGGEARPVTVGLVNPGFFTTLGVRPAAGRLLADADEQRNCPGVAVITHAFWQSEYGGRPDVVGKSFTLTGRAFQILGVTEPAFFGVEFGQSVPIWSPQCAGAILRGYVGGGWIFGRLKPGLTLEQSRARLAALAPAILDATAAPNAPAKAAADSRRTTFDIVPFAKGLPALSRTYGQALFALMAIVAVVLLIACANAANLLLARATARRREIGVRLALGASRARLIRQLLTESLLLSLISAAGGTLCALVGSRLLVSLLLRRRQAVPLDLTPDARVLTFTLTVAAVTGILFGLAPAWRAVRVDARASANANGLGGGRGVAEGQSRFGVGKALVVGQIALSFVMIVGAGLLVSSWQHLAALDPGFRSNGVLVVDVSTQQAQLTPDQRGVTYSRILERLRATPNVTSASAAWRTPFGTNATLTISAERSSDTSAGELRVRYNEISAGYFATIGIPVLAGRDFNSADVPSAPEPAIVNEELARTMFGGLNILGRRFRVAEDRALSPPVEIVGVVANTKESSLTEQPKPIVYFPLSRNARPGTSYGFALRTTGPTSATVPRVRSAVAEINPRLLLTLGTLQERIDDSVRLPRALGMLSGFFAVLALLLGSVGLYGIMAYSVARRRNEIGVRIALGAARARVVRMVLGESGRLVVLGVILGTLLSAALTRLVRTLLFGIEPNDPTTLVLSAVTLTTVAIGAALLPAWRAARLDPIAALREE